MTRIPGVGVDVTTGGIANDSLVTLDGTGNYVYHMTDLVLTGNLYLPEGQIFQNQDEDGAWGGGGNRELCERWTWAWPTSGTDWNNTAGAQSGFLAEMSALGTGLVVDPLEVCQQLELNQGGFWSMGPSAVLLQGDLNGGIQDHMAGQFPKTTKIYSPTYDGTNIVQHETRNIMFGANCENGIAEMTNASKIFWMDCDGGLNNKNVGQAIWLKGSSQENRTAGNFQSGNSSETFYGTTICTQNHSSIAYGVYVDLQGSGNGYSFYGADNGSYIFNMAGIRAGHATTQYLEIDHDGTSAEINAQGATDQIEFQFGSTSVMELTSAGHLLVSGDVDSARLSDKQYKDNIKHIDNALDMINEMNGVSYTWNEKSPDHLEGEDIGVIAQEVEQVVPECVVTRDDGSKAVKYDKLVPILIEAVKELSSTVTKLEDKIENLSSSDRSTSF